VPAWPELGLRCAGGNAFCAPNLSLPSALSRASARQWGLQEPRLGRLAWVVAPADLDRRPYHPRQDIDARQSRPARAVRAGGPDGSSPPQSRARYGLTPSSEAGRKPGTTTYSPSRSPISSPVSPDGSQPGAQRPRPSLRGTVRATAEACRRLEVEQRQLCRSALTVPARNAPHNVPAEERPHGTNKPIRREPVRCRFPAEVCERMKWRVLPVPSALRRSVR
jgi:hypothetical protein